MVFYFKCMMCELTMTITGPAMDALDRIGMGRHEARRIALLTAIISTLTFWLFDRLSYPRYRSENGGDR